MNKRSETDMTRAQRSIAIIRGLLVLATIMLCTSAALSQNERKPMIWVDFMPDWIQAWPSSFYRPFIRTLRSAFPNQVNEEIGVSALFAKADPGDHWIKIEYSSKRVSEGHHASTIVLSWGWIDACSNPAFGGIDIIPVGVRDNFKLLGYEEAQEQVLRLRNAMKVRGE